jgi:hypothetical protein
VGVVVNKYRIRLVETRDVDVEAPNLAAAERRAQMLLAANPHTQAKLVSIHRVITEVVNDGVSAKDS